MVIRLINLLTDYDSYLTQFLDANFLIPDVFKFLIIWLPVEVAFFFIYLFAFGLVNLVFKHTIGFSFLSENDYFVDKYFKPALFISIFAGIFTAFLSRISIVMNYGILVEKTDVLISFTLLSTVLNILVFIGIGRIIKVIEERLLAKN